MVTWKIVFLYQPVVFRVHVVSISLYGLDDFTRDLETHLKSPKLLSRQSLERSYPRAVDVYEPAWTHVDRSLEVGSVFIYANQHALIS